MNWDMVMVDERRRQRQGKPIAILWFRSFTPRGDQVPLITATWWGWPPFTSPIANDDPRLR